MDEGKPTKAKWWSRPRPQEPKGDRHTADDADMTPVPPPPTPDGDFELARPGIIGGCPADDAGPGGGDGRADEACEAAGTADAPHGDVVPTDGTFDGTGSQEAAAGPVGDRPGVVPVVVSTAVPEPVAVERPKPLHDPDPYSTPPYGEPGPWAPAPPVQH
ncbi:protease, partial [Streptomyces sp. ID05-04B]|nr:protease [Streptomyces sp. ID05-04B]